MIPGLQSPEDGGDSLAIRESQALVIDQDLEKLAKARAVARREDFRNHYHRALIVLFWGFFLVLGTAGLVWAWHLLLPDPAHFLDQAQLGKIESTFFSGTLSAGLSMAMKEKYFN